MSRRRRTREAGSALSSLEQTAEDIYRPELPADIVQLDSQRRNTRLTDIFDIYPDRTQPRRSVPSRIRQTWDGSPHTVAAMYNTWLEEIRQSGWPGFALEPFLEEAFLPDGIDGNADETADATQYMQDYGPLEQPLLAIVDLAVSIRKVGLTNPITIARSDRVYQLETGERRWLAYHLLNLYFPDDGWGKIPAQLVEEISVWRQASENNARADLNAIGKARQLAILLMDLLRERGYEFLALDDVLSAGQSERAYYAQVADGDAFRVPRGDGERLLLAMGLKNPTQLRQYRRLLRLNDEAWQHADDHNLTEGEIRKMLNRNTSYGISSKQQAGTPDGNPFVERNNKRRRTRIWSYASRLHALNEKDRQKAISAIEEDQRWLQELKQALSRKN